MPLRDHFRPPLDDLHSWDELHGGWPMVMVQHLVKILPEPYFAAPGVHLGTIRDVYEVRVYDNRRNRNLVAAIEIVSPSNKDRPGHRAAFVAKVAALLTKGICVSVVDVVSTMDFNLYAELLECIGEVDPALGDDPPPMCAATLRTRYEGTRKMMDTWYHPLAVGQPLPTLPIWLKERLSVPLELEASYEEACQTLRMR